MESCALYTQNPLKRTLNKVNGLNTSKKNINTQTTTEKTGNKINIYQNKSKIPNCKNRRPNHCISEKYFENDKKREKKRLPVNRS